MSGCIVVIANSFLLVVKQFVSIEYQKMTIRMTERVEKVTFSDLFSVLSTHIFLVKAVL